MATLSMSGNDTVVINGRVFTDLADGTVAELTFPNKIADGKIGKNGNAIFAQNATGKLAELKIRVMRASPDDKFLNALIVSQNTSFQTFPLMNGQVTKIMGDGNGNVTNDTTFLDSGYFSKPVELKSNVEGDTEQSVAIYMLEFANSLSAIPRVIG